MKSQRLRKFAVRIIEKVTVFHFTLCFLLGYSIIVGPVKWSFFSLLIMGLLAYDVLESFKETFKLEDVLDPNTTIYGEPKDTETTEDEPKDPEPPRQTALEDLSEIEKSGYQGILVETDKGLVAVSMGPKKEPSEVVPEDTETTEDAPEEDKEDKPKRPRTKK